VARGVNIPGVQFVRVYPSIADVDQAEWTRVADSAGASAFYDYAFLRAYERAPLQDTDAFFYLMFGKPAVAILPAYVQSTDDAIGMVAGLGLPGRLPGDRMLLTHVTHCYDTVFPALPGHGLTARACTAMADLARQQGVKWFAFLNVDGAAPIAAELTAAGLAKIPMYIRFRADVSAYQGVEEFVADVPGKKARYTLRRSHRRALQQGMEIVSPCPAAAAGAIELCRRTTARHGTAGYYPEHFGDFVALAADLVQVTEVRLGGRLASAAICLCDRTRFHLWAGGLDHEVAAYVHNSFPLMLWSAVADTIRLDRPILEAGRGNVAVKTHFGLSPIPLFAFVGQP
jgi:predicted N-acyltransferase